MCVAGAVVLLSVVLVLSALLLQYVTCSTVVSVCHVCPCVTNDVPFIESVCQLNFLSRLD